MGVRARHRPNDLLRNDRKLLGRSSPPLDLQVESAEGSIVRDARGRTFLDFQMGWCVGNLGWNPAEIVAAVRELDGPTYVSPNALYAPWAELANLLAEVAPGRARRAWRCVGGSEAVELALELAMTYTHRHKLVSIEGAYHGNTFAARSVGSGELETGLRGCHHLKPPLDTDALDRLETLLKHREIAAVIMEPIITNLNVLIPDDAFMRELVPLCHRFGTLVIMDEVATGFGRTGAMFGSEHFDIAPDIVCMAKAITSGVAPLAATMTTADIAEECEGELAFYSTFGWHPVAVEAAIATLRFWQQYRDDLLANVAVRSIEFRSRLAAMPWATNAEINIKGLAVAVKLDDEDYVSRIEKRCFDEGLLLYGEEDSLVMFPALTLDQETAQRGLGILERCVIDAR